MRISVLLLSAILIVFSSCHQSKKIKIGTSIKGSRAEKVGTEIADYLNINGWEVEVVSGGDYSGSKNIKALQEDLVDFAFVSNDVAFSKDSKSIQTVMPLYPDLSYIFYRNNLEPKNLAELIENNSILMSEDDGKFFLKLFEYYGLNTKTLSLYPKEPL